ncbi:hypothetical protein C8Q77DRAFT_1220911 [Trametes polyzona]|nr:hypothetical protein C8Q77DRAFT_1220911 [Trametes polyzona]
MVSSSLPSVASLPSLPSFAHSKLNRLPAVDMEHDRLARACGQGLILVGLSSEFASSSNSHAGPSHVRGSPSKLASGSHTRSFTPPTPLAMDEPILDIPFALSWGLRPRATSVRVPQRHSPPHLPSRPRSTSQPASIPVFAPSSPRGVLRSLRDALDLEGMRLEDCLDVHAVFERWDAQSERGLARGEAGQPHQRTFGAPVGVAVRHASMSTVLGGYQHHVPWVVYACVEELNRTGIYQPGLFRAVPNRTRLARLVEAFDLSSPVHTPSPDDMECPKMRPTPSSTRASLRKESMADICALLKTYLDMLPEPLLDSNLSSALYELCVQPHADNDADESEGDRGFFASRARSAPPTTSFSGYPDVPMTPSEHRSAQLSLEEPFVVLAQHILRLAPPSHLAVLAYLLGFFTQLPLCPDNGIDFTDVARMFGRVLLGRPSNTPADSTSTRECVLWLLERWARISDGLFDIAAGSEATDGLADSAPATACRATFDSPPLHSAQTTPRLGGHCEGGQGQSGTVRIQMPYDPGLCERVSFRSHSTSVSSDSSSATTASFESDELLSGDTGLSYAALRTKDDLSLELARAAVEEYGSSLDLYEREKRSYPSYALGRDFVSCPSSPRQQSERGLCSPPTSVRSLDIESLWDYYSGSTSRCSPSPSPMGGRVDALDSDSEPYEDPHETTPRNSASFPYPAS